MKSPIKYVLLSSILNVFVLLNTTDAKDILYKPLPIDFIDTLHGDIYTINEVCISYNDSQFRQKNQDFYFDKGICFFKFTKFNEQNNVVEEISKYDKSAYFDDYYFHYITEYTSDTSFIKFSFNFFGECIGADTIITNNDNLILNRNYYKFEQKMRNYISTNSSECYKYNSKNEKIYYSKDIKIREYGFDKERSKEYDSTNLNSFIEIYEYDKFGNKILDINIKNNDTIHHKIKKYNDDNNLIYESLRSSGGIYGYIKFLYDKERWVATQMFYGEDSLFYEENYKYDVNGWIIKDSSYVYFADRFLYSKDSRISKAAGKNWNEGGIHCVYNMPLFLPNGYSSYISKTPEKIDKTIIDNDQYKYKEIWYFLDEIYLEIYYDKKDNWIKLIEYNEGDSYAIVERIIVYR